MGALLEELRRLQAIELQLSALRRTGETKAGRADAYRRQVREIEERLLQSRTQARETQMKIDELSLDVAAKEESINRHRQALNKAKTNKEYAAVLAAMNIEKADNAKVEDAILRLMDELSSIKGDSAAIETEKSKLLEQAAAAEQALKAFEEQSEAERRRLLADREQLAARINLQTIETFNRVAEHHDGEAMAPVNKLRPKRDEWSCGGCNMAVTLEVVNALQTRDEIQTCKVCGRILYLESTTPKSVRV